MSATDITALLHARDGQRGFLDGHNSAAEDLIGHLAAAGRLVRVAGEGTAWWEWVEATGG